MKVGSVTSSLVNRANDGMILFDYANDVKVDPFTITSTVCNVYIETNIFQKIYKSTLFWFDISFTSVSGSGTIDWWVTITQDSQNFVVTSEVYDGSSKYSHTNSIAQIIFGGKPLIFN